MQRFFFERFKGRPHFFQPGGGKSRCLFRPVDFVAPVLALVFVEQVVAVFPCPLVKLPLVLQRLLLPALIAAQLIPLALSKEDAPADLALLEAQPPVVEPVQVIGNQRIKGSIDLKSQQPPINYRWLLASVQETWSVILLYWVKAGGNLD